MFGYCCNMEDRGTEPCPNCKKTFIYKTAYALQHDVRILVLDVAALKKTGSPLNSMRYVTLDCPSYLGYAQMQNTYAKER